MTGDNLVGEILGERYEILEKIGAGGMATVYKAKDTLLNRNVAIKILRDSLEEEEQVVTNFVKEAQASAGLVHNNIVSVYDVCETDELNYMVMELVDGITLKQYIKEKGILPWQEACDYAIQIAQGLGEAHANNIIHCDIKPQNIIMTEDKTVKVTDFGIAKAVSGGTIVATEKNSAMGSVHYISPEQARGGFTDARSDIYSLGIVMYEMLAGKVPFDGDNPVGIAMKHLEEEPVNVKCINFDIPTDLAYIVMKAINKVPEDRYSDAQEMLNDLHAVLAGEPLPSKNEINPEAELDEPDYDDDEDDFVAFDEDAEEIVNNNTDNLRTRKSTKKGKKGKKTKEQKRANRTATWLAIVTVLAIVLVSFGVYALVTNVLTKSTVPNFENMKLEEAKTLAEQNSLIISDEDIEYSISDTVEDGCIISQLPEAGTHVDKNSEVKVVVSIGSRGGDIPVPDLSNKTRDEALIEIDKVNLKATVIEENSNTVAAGNVIRQTPIAGTKLFKDDYVTIYISKGIASSVSTAAPNKSIRVPALTGGDLDSARNALSSAGLSLGNVTVVYSDAPYGTIISQSVNAGSAVAQGSSVGVVISGGTEPEYTAPEEPTNPEENNENTNGGNTENGYEGSSSGGSASGTKTFYVSIPDGNGDASVEVYVNGELVHEGTYSRDSGTIPVDITGSGTVNVTAYVDGVAQSQTIDFGG